MKRPFNKPVERRIHISLSERDAERLERLAHLTNAASQSEVTKRALLIYEILANHLATGAVLYTKETVDGPIQRYHLLLDVPKPAASA